MSNTLEPRGLLQFDPAAVREAIKKLDRDACERKNRAVNLREETDRYVDGLYEERQELLDEAELLREILRTCGYDEVEMTEEVLP